MKITLRDKIAILTVFLFGAITTINSLSSLPNTNASLNQFDPGRIMDDAVMANFNSMNQAEIQRFLKSKNPCNDRDLDKAKKYPHLQYHIKNGKFVCMAEETFDGESAAKIIADASRDYKINPQVLLVLLEKEQSLVTDTWPNSTLQYRSATGYGCPDTAACDSSYYGFKNQVRNAAKLFRSVLNGGSPHFPLGTNFIKYHPSTTCGGSKVKIKNLATSALYRYTPYQPNQASVNAGYGRGDSCSSYGNRNFYKYFRDWFGSTWSTQSSGNTLTSQSTSSLADGIYYIKSREFNGYQLDVSGASQKNQANIQIYRANGTDAQKFKIKYHHSGGYYTLENLNSAKMVNLKEPVHGSNVHQYKSTGNCDERWRLEKISDGSFRIGSTCDKDLYLDIQTTGDLKNVFAKNSYNTKTKTWDFVSVHNSSSSTQSSSNTSHVGNQASSLPDGNYIIVSQLKPWLLIDVQGGSLQQGANIHIWNANNTGAQKFKVTYQPVKQSYTIINTQSGKALDVEGASRNKGTKIHQWQVNNTCAQDWKIISTGGGYYKLVSGCSDMVLDVRGAGLVSGTPVQIWHNNNTLAQRWKFEKL